MKNTRTIWNYWSLIAFVLPVLFVIIATYVVPRHYYWNWADVEQAFYYFSRQIFLGLPVAELSHPATPVEYLGAVFFYFCDTGLPSAQDFFNIGYMVAGVLTGLSFAYFASRVLRRLPTGLSFLSIAVMMAMPTLLTHLNLFGSDSFLFPVALVTTIWFWTSLETFDQKRLLILHALTGIGLGLMLAIKLSALPLFLVTIVVAVLQIAWSPKVSVGRGLLNLLILPTLSVLSFLLFTLPIFNRLPELAVHFSGRSDILPNLTDGARAWLQILAHWALNPLLVAWAAISMLFVLSAARRVIFLVRQWHARVGEARPDILKALFLFGLLASIIYSGAAILPDQLDPGMALRNMQAMLVFFPFAVAFIAHSMPRLTTRSIQPVLLILAAVILICSFFGYMTMRSAFIKAEAAETAALEAEFSQYLRTDRRLAFWDGSPGNMFGPASFHFWGNYRYAQNQFDDELLSMYPGMTIIKLRDVDRLILEMESGQPIPYLPSRGRLLDLWSRYFPATVPPLNSELIVGETSGVRPDLIIILKSEVLALNERGISLDTLIDLIEYHIGAVDVTEKSIRGVEWLLIFSLDS